MQVGSKSNDKYPYGDTFSRNIEKRRKSHVKIEAEIGIIQPQLKKCLEHHQKLDEARKIPS